MISKHIPRAISRPNGRKAIKRLCADLQTLIDRAPTGTPPGQLLRSDRKLADLRDILEAIYRDRFGEIK